MILPTKTLPATYVHRDSVNIKKQADVLIMLIWSMVLFVLPLPLIYLVLDPKGDIPVIFSVSTLAGLLTFLGCIVAVTVVMLVVHEGLHGLVFWLTTREKPKFAFKWYYASACAEGWYLPRTPYLIATLLPLVAITAAGLLILPAVSHPMKYFITLVIVFNSSGCAGDALVAWRLLRLPKETLSVDKGDEVDFFSPVQD